MVFGTMRVARTRLSRAARSFDRRFPDCIPVNSITLGEWPCLSRFRWIVSSRAAANLRMGRNRIIAATLLPLRLRVALVRRLSRNFYRTREREGGREGGYTVHRRLHSIEQPLCSPRKLSIISRFNSHLDGSSLKLAHSYKWKSDIRWP